MGVRGLQLGNHHRSSEERRGERAFADCSWGITIGLAKRGAEDGRWRIAAGSRHRSSEDRRRERAFADVNWGAIEIAKRGAGNGRPRIAGWEPP